MTDETKRPNYYILLDLDPTQPWNDDAFQKAVTTKRAEWTKRTRHPKYGTLYTSYLDMVPRIRDVMSDPARREAEAQAALEIRSQEQRQLEAQFAEEIALLVAKGFVTEADIAALVKTYARLHNEEAIRQQIKAQGVAVRAVEAPAFDEADTLDAGTVKHIETQLELLGKEDLYDFLEQAPTAQTGALHQRAQAIYDDTQRKATKTADVTAASVLAGYAMRLFKDEEQRNRYDNAMIARKYETALGEPLRRVLQGPDKTLYAGQFQKLLEQARASGLDVDKAEAYLRGRAKALGAAIEVTDTATVKVQRLCPACDTLNDATARICANCGTALEMNCPGCGKLLPTEFNACTYCGFPIGDMFVIRQRLDDAFDLLRRQRYDLADEKLKNGWFLWDGLPPVNHRNDMVEDLEWRFNEGFDELDWQKENIGALRQHIKERRFYTARALLREIEAQWDAAILADEGAAIDAAIAACEQKLKDAAAYSGDEAVAAYMDILSDCTDCQAARDALARTPPAPPTDLRVHQGASVISLEWAPSPSANVHYTVVRKGGARPVAATDGEVLATVAGTRYEDTAPQVGVPTYYAVYADRAGVRSVEAAHGDADVFVVRPVTQLTAAVQDQTVHLRWQAPANITSVTVVRAVDDFPRTPQEGDLVRVLGQSSAVDGGLENGRTYYYSVFPVFDDRDGVPVAGPPASVSATPQKPPAIISALGIDVLRTGPRHELILRWEGPDKGEVVILQSDTRPDLDSGAILPEGALAQHGDVLHGADGELRTSVGGGKVVYFTPVVLFEGMAYPGPAQPYAGVEDVRDLRVQNLGTELQLRWEWPANCTRVIVAYRHDDFPAPDEAPDTTRTTVTRAEYDLKGYFAIANPVRRDYYITIFAVIGTGTLSPGLTARRHVTLSSRITIHYRIERQRKLLGKGALVLTLQITGPGQVPDILVVRKQGAIPTVRTDGDIILRIDGAAVQPPAARFVLDDSAEHPMSFARLFLADEDRYESRGGHVRIVHPAQDKMKVF